MLRRNTLLTICNSFLWPHVDYGDIVYDQLNTQIFPNKSEAFQYNAAVAITNAIKGPSRAKHYKEFMKNEYKELILLYKGAESLSFRWWFRRLCNFNIIKTQGQPKYPHNMIPFKNNTYDTHSRHLVDTSYCRTNAFKYSFFTYTIWGWNKIALQLPNAESFNKFRNTLLKFGRPTRSPIYGTHHHLDLNLNNYIKARLEQLQPHSGWAFLEAAHG